MIATRQKEEILPIGREPIASDRGLGNDPRFIIIVRNRPAAKTRRCCHPGKLSGGKESCKRPAVPGLSFRVDVRTNPLGLSRQPANTIEDIVVQRLGGAVDKKA